jgi:nucleotide-binding universal stress UspA family protein
MRLLTLKTVLVAVARDDVTRAAIQAGSALASSAGGTLHVIHVSSDPSVTLETLAASILDGVDACVHVVAGDAAESIRSTADRLRADVIVLGPHRGGVRTRRGSALGSTALGVVTNAAVPCLVVAKTVELPVRRACSCPWTFRIRRAEHCSSRCPGPQRLEPLVRASRLSSRPCTSV